MAQVSLEHEVERVHILLENLSKIRGKNANSRVNSALRDQGYSITEIRYGRALFSGTLDSLNEPVSSLFMEALMIKKSEFVDKDGLVIARKGSQPSSGYVANARSKSHVVDEAAYQQHKEVIHQMLEARTAKKSSEPERKTFDIPMAVPDSDTERAAHEDELGPGGEIVPFRTIKLHTIKGEPVICIQKPQYELILFALRHVLEFTEENSPQFAPADEFEKLLRFMSSVHAGVNLITHYKLGDRIDEVIRKTHEYYDDEGEGEVKAEEPIAWSFLESDQVGEVCEVCHFEPSMFVIHDPTTVYICEACVRSKSGLTELTGERRANLFVDLEKQLPAAIKRSAQI